MPQRVNHKEGQTRENESVSAPFILNPKHCVRLRLPHHRCLLAFPGRYNERETVWGRTRKNRTSTTRRAASATPRTHRMKTKCNTCEMSERTCCRDGRTFAIETGWLDAEFRKRDGVLAVLLFVCTGHGDSSLRFEVCENTLNLIRDPVFPCRITWHQGPVWRSASCIMRQNIRA